MTPRVPSPDAIETSRPDKLLWPSAGVTKRDYAAYLDAVAERILPWLRDRPLTVIRAPDGVEAHRYFQKAVSSYAPGWIRTVRIPAPSAGRDVDYVVCGDHATLRWLGNQAAVELHPAPVRADRLDRPDLLVVDIDPPEGAFEAAAQAAGLVADVLDDLGVVFGVKTTGGKGLHVVAPLERRYGADRLRHAAARLTDLVASRRPDLITAAFRKKDRGGKVLLDPSRNGTGATIVAPYSPRARPHAPVAFPIALHELATIDPDGLTIATVPDRLEGPGPRWWSELLEHRGRLPAELLRET